MLRLSSGHKYKPFLHFRLVAEAFTFTPVVKAFTFPLVAEAFTFAPVTKKQMARLLVAM